MYLVVFMVSVMVLYDMSKTHTTVAIVYDFDGTLAKGNIQENSFILQVNVLSGNYQEGVVHHNYASHNVKHS